MAVSPEFQNQGIGSKLIREGLKVCAAEGCEAIFVLGHANYYPRFGFEIAKTEVLPANILCRTNILWFWNSKEML